MYKVVVSKSASKELQDLPSLAVGRIIEALRKLQTEPRPPGSKKLRGTSDLWRVRVGDYRIVYAIEDTIRVVDIRKIGHRKDIYE